MTLSNDPLKYRLDLVWRKCPQGEWCRFESAVVPDAPASGILLVWSGADQRIILVYVGQGGIARNLKWARQFEPILRRPGLFVTWASVPEDQQNGVRNYLVESLGPVYSDRPSSDPPICVNLPWA